MCILNVQGQKCDKCDTFVRSQSKSMFMSVTLVRYRSVTPVTPVTVQDSFLSCLISIP